MISWTALGTRVTLRYRRPPGSVPPLTDAVGHLLEIDPTVRLQTKSGAIIEVAAAEVTALRILTHAPLRTADIRNLEYAAAAATPGREQTWLEGWLLRAHGGTLAANSAVPLHISANSSSIPAIVDWYDHRGLTPRLVIPDRLLTPPAGLACEFVEQILVYDIAILPRADSGEQRATVTDAPDGTRWLAMATVPTHDRWENLLAWGAARGATRAYLGISDTDSTELAESLGFRRHHRRRYLYRQRDEETNYARRRG